MTALDEFVPEGEPIHPFDVFELLDKTVCYTMILKRSPDPEDEDDFIRNRSKIGQVIVLDGCTYFETTSVDPKTTRYK